MEYSIEKKVTEVNLKLTMDELKLLHKAMGKMDFGTALYVSLGDIVVKAGE